MKKGLIAILAVLGGASLGTVGIGKVLKDKLRNQTEMSDKHFALYLMMNQWVKVKQENKSIAQYLEGLGYRSIAIYGMNYAGQTLLSELKNTNIKVNYGIDNNAEQLCANDGIDIMTPDAELLQVDAVIVTAITFYDEIEDKLSQKMDCPIISLEDILYGV